MQKKLRFQQATFLKSAANLCDLPTNSTTEVAFVGRSNAGKSSALNAICSQNTLARISKTPGRTQLINFFQLPDLENNYFLVDLPGYGYAKVATQIKETWQKLLSDYLETRTCLRGIILLIDIRHPLKALDQQMLNWCQQRNLNLHILLTKADKLSFGQAKTALLQLNKYLIKNNSLSSQLFSAHSKLGIEEAKNIINTWLLTN